MLDTRIVGTVNRAFSRVCFAFTTEAGEQAEVELDMEASIDLLWQMDEGKQALDLMGFMKRQKDVREARGLPWWKRIF
jgi:hypothetical protein